jgi:hypothetical protein
MTCDEDTSDSTIFCFNFFHAAYFALNGKWDISISRSSFLLLLRNNVGDCHVVCLSCSYASLHLNFRTSWPVCKIWGFHGATSQKTAFLKLTTFHERILCHWKPVTEQKVAKAGTLSENHLAPLELGYCSVYGKRYSQNIKLHWSNPLL